MKTTTEIKNDMEYEVNNYGDISNEYIATIFEGEMLYKDLKFTHIHHWHTTNLVVKTHKYINEDDGDKMIHYEVYFDTTLVLELRYSEKTTRDMKYHLDELESELENESLPHDEELNMSIFGRKECGMMTEDEIDVLFSAIDKRLELTEAEEEDYKAGSGAVIIMMTKNSKVNVVIDLSYHAIPIVEEAEEGEESDNHQYRITMWMNDTLVYHIFGDVNRGYKKTGIIHDIIHHNESYMEYMETQRKRKECSTKYKCIVDKVVSETILNNDTVKHVLEFTGF